VCGNTALALGVAEADEKLGPVTVLGVRGPAEQFESLGVPADGFLRGKLVQGTVARQLCVADGLARVDGLDGGRLVVGEFAGAFSRIGAVLGLEGLGHGAWARDRRAGQRLSYRVCSMRAWANV